jgi:hypothetical protein
MVAGADCYCRRAYILWCVAQQPSCSCRRAEGRNEEAGVILAYPAADAASRTRWRGRVVACAAAGQRNTTATLLRGELSNESSEVKGVNKFIYKKSVIIKKKVLGNIIKHNKILNNSDKSDFTISESLVSHKEGFRSNRPSALPCAG